MKDINLLFLAPHWRVSLINAFREARSNLTVPGQLVGADSDPLAPALRVVDSPHVLPPFSQSRCLETLNDICRKESIHSILPMTNKAVEFLDTHRDSFQRDDLLIYLQDPRTIEICHDKLKLAQFLNDHNIPTPETGIPGRLGENPIFPMIAKERRGEGGKNSHIVEDRKDLDFYAGKFPGHVFQRFVEGREYTIDWFSDREGKPLLIVPRERLAVRGGEVTTSRIHMDPALIESAKTVGALLRLHGPCTLQGILDPSNRFLFTDVNLRFGSGVVHTIASGGEMPVMIFKELGGGSPDSARKTIRDGSVMTRFYDAFFDPSQSQ